MNEPIKCDKCGGIHYEGNCKFCGKPFRAFWVLQVFCSKPARCKVNYFNKKARDERAAKRGGKPKQIITESQKKIARELREKALDKSSRK